MAPNCLQKRHKDKDLPCSHQQKFNFHSVTNFFSYNITIVTGSVKFLADKYTQRERGLRSILYLTIQNGIPKRSKGRTRNTHRFSLFSTRTYAYHYSFSMIKVVGIKYKSCDGHVSGDQSKKVKPLTLS